MTAVFTPTDHEMRQRIISAVGENMCVEAGAGTGKTHVLVDRAVQVVRTGHATIEQMVIITFTERAAAELSTRVRRGLEAALASGAAPDEGDRLRAALHSLHTAHIETIHAFATSLLRERPIEAGIDPGFRVLDELPSQLAFEEAYADWITEETGDAAPPALVDALNLGIKWPQIREAAERLHRHRDALPLPAYQDTQPDFSLLLATMEAALAEFAGLLHTLRNEESPTALEYGRMVEVHEQLCALQSYEPAMEALVAGVKPPSTSKGRKDDWFPESTHPKTVLGRIRTALEETQAAIRQRSTSRLVHWLQEFVGFYDRRRRAESLADFDDLLVWARNLIRTNNAARDYFRDKYRCFLVDEFQDTDPIQVEMIVRLCAEDDPADWRDASLRPGSLFVVGDPKQSIYRFRRADVAMYDAVKRGLFGGNVVPITQNFRSGRAIIDWVNTVFDPLMTEEVGVQAAYAALESHPAFAPGAVSIAPLATGDGAAGVLRNAEAAAIASLIRARIDAGVWQVRDGDGGLRTATLADVVILIPSRTDLRLYEDALARAGVPYLHEGGRTFFQRQEVRDLTAILRAIDDPADATAVVASLRSEAFACSDDDLITHRKHASFDYLTLRDDVPGRAADAMRTLRDLARARHSQPVVSLVREVVDRLKLVEIAILHPQGEQAAANVLKVLDQARAYSEARPAAGLRGFVRWLRANLERDSDETDASISEDADDVVRILTVHASKGLEFPIVIFANMNTERADRTYAIVSRLGDAPSFEMRIGATADGFRTPGFEHADMRERLHTGAEQLRLLYVAATRAKDHLIVPFVAKDHPLGAQKPRDEPRSLNEHLRRAGEARLRGEPHHHVDLVDPSSLVRFSEEPPPVRGERLSDVTRAGEIVARRDAWLAERGAVIRAASAGLRIVTATSLKPEWEAAASHDEMRRGQATEFGIAVHTALERVALDDSLAIDAVCAAVACEYGFDERAAELTTYVRNALGSNVIERARRSDRVLRESPFTVATPGGGMAEGRMDLLFIEDGAVIVVDFKSDRVSVGEARSRTHGVYRTQALAYAWAAHRAIGLPVREVVFLYVRLPHEEVVRVDDAFITEAEALIAAPALA